MHYKICLRTTLFSLVTISSSILAWIWDISSEGKCFLRLFMLSVHVLALLQRSCQSDLRPCRRDRQSLMLASAFSKASRAWNLFRNRNLINHKNTRPQINLCPVESITKTAAARGSNAAHANFDFFVCNLLESCRLLMLEAVTLNSTLDSLRAVWLVFFGRSALAWSFVTSFFGLFFRRGMVLNLLVKDSDSGIFAVNRW